MLCKWSISGYCGCKTTKNFSDYYFCIPYRKILGIIPSGEIEIAPKCKDFVLKADLIEDLKQEGGER
ncbi:MAG: hypothetical protein MRK02_13925 [Candidatus Scalindua sp.]|nr:hypothetical protein [Candidatus Scalindua sp.]